MAKNEEQATPGTGRDKEVLSITPVILAADRTLLAWIRTSLSMIGFGFLIHQAAIFLKQEGVLSGDTRFFGLGLWVFGIIILIFASWEHFSLRRRLVKNESLDVLRRPLSLIVAIGMCVAGSVGLISFLFFQHS